MQRSSPSIASLAAALAKAQAELVNPETGRSLVTKADGKGKDGLVGYLMALAAVEPRTFGALLRALLPLQIAPKYDDMITFRSSEELREELIKQGVPASFLTLPRPRLVTEDEVLRDAEEKPGREN